jgi:CubicO group peptidase (beta-lactamase class C family)
MTGVTVTHYRVLRKVGGAAFALALSVTAGCANDETLSEPWQWPESTPMEQQVDEAPLLALDAAIKAGQHGNIDSVLVVRNGHVVFEREYRRDYAPFNAGSEAPSWEWNYQDEHWHPWYHGDPSLHTMQSVSKSVLAVLYGIASRQGKFGSVDVPALALLKSRDIADPDGRKAAIMLRDMLTMRSGLAWDEESFDYTDPRNDCAVMEASDDWVAEVVDKPMVADPDTTWVYSSGTTMVLTEILEELVGMKLADFAEQELFGPLGITEYYWKHTPMGLADAEGGLYLRPRDIAKVVQLWIDGGRWGEQQIVSADWVRESVAPTTPSTYPEDSGMWARVGYGYQWWNFTNAIGDGLEIYGGVGYGGQWPIAVPELGLVVVLTGWNIYSRETPVLELIQDHVLSAIQDGG